MSGREEIPMKSRFGTAAVIAALLGALACASASAHHSFAVFFDSEDGVISVRGVVTQFNFTNPHGVIRLNVKDQTGTIVEWKAETNSPSILERRGWKKDSLKVGEEIVVEGWRARDGANYMRMRKVTRADGTPVGIPFASLEVK
jgi:proline racemase